MNQHTHNDIFTGWMNDHRGIVVKIVRSFASSPADAEDLTQEVTLAIWRSVPSFRGGAKPSTWIWRVALNRAISWQRSAVDDAGQAPIDEVAELTAIDRADERVAVARLYRLLRSLAPIDRSLMVLSLEGHSYAEMADITALSETNVGARLSRARARLTELIETEDA